MGTVETAGAMNNSMAMGQVQVSVLRKAMETSQQMAMDLIQKQSQISEKLQMTESFKGQNIDVRA